MPNWLHKTLTAVATVGVFAAKSLIPATAVFLGFPVATEVAAGLVVLAAVGIQPAAVSSALSNLFHGSGVTQATAVAMQAALTKGKPQL